MSVNFSPTFIIIMTLLIVTTTLKVVKSDDGSIKVPYPGYLDALNSTVDSLIGQLMAYKQYIAQAFKPLEQYKEVFPKPMVEFEKMVNEAPNVTSDTPRQNDLKEEDVVQIDDDDKSSSTSFEKKQIAVTLKEANNNLTNVDQPDLTTDRKLIESPDADVDTSNDADRKMWDDDEEEETDKDGDELMNEDSVVDKSSEISKQELMSLQRFLKNDPNIIIFPQDDKDRNNNRKSSPNVSQIDNRISDHRPKQQQQQSSTPAGLGLGEGDTVRTCGQFDGQFEEVQLKWNIAIGSNEGSGFLFGCGGVLISPLIAVTSASCLYKKKLTLVRLSGTELWNISFVKLHPQYNDNLIYNDIGLVKLRKRLDVDRSLLPCIPSNQRQAVIGPSTSDDPIETIATDWKFKLRNRSLNLLPITKISEIIPNSNCESSYLEYFRKYSLNFQTAFPRGVDSSLICAELTGQIDCEKNVGYQLVSRSLESPYSLVGTSTKGKINCDFMHLPGIYTNISFFSSWIRQATNAAVRRPKN